MPDYSKGKIYKIVVDTDEEYKPYVGSTCQELSQRMAEHRGSYKRWKNCKQTKCNCFNLFDLFGVDKCKIILLEEYFCENNNQLRAKEREWFEKIPNCNQVIPLRTYTEKIDKSKEYYIEYYKKNIEENSKKITCNCGSIIRKDEKTRHEKTQKHISFISQN